MRFTNALPVKARMSVLVIVPTASLPMFMPERNKSLKRRFGLTVFNSVMEEEMLMATSMTAPKAEMMIPDTNSPRMLMSVPW